MNLSDLSSIPNDKIIHTRWRLKRFTTWCPRQSPLAHVCNGRSDPSYGWSRCCMRSCHGCLLFCCMGCSAMGTLALAGWTGTWTISSGTFTSWQSSLGLITQLGHLFRCMMSRTGSALALTRWTRTGSITTCTVTLCLSLEWCCSCCTCITAPCTCMIISIMSISRYSSIIISGWGTRCLWLMMNTESCCCRSLSLMAHGNVSVRLWSSW